MPSISRYMQQIAPMRSLPQAEASPEVFGANVGRALVNIGAQHLQEEERARRIAEAEAAQKKRSQDMVRATEILAQHDLDLSRAQRDAIGNIADDGAGFADGLDKFAITTRENIVKNLLPGLDPDVAVRVQEGLIKNEASFREKNYMTEATQRDRYSVAGLQKSIAAITERASVTGDYSRAEADLNAALQIAKGAIPIDKLTEIEIEAKGKLRQQTWNYRLATDPEGVIADLTQPAPSGDARKNAVAVAAQAESLGIDPHMAASIFGVESSWGTDAKAENEFEWHGKGKIGTAEQLQELKRRIEVTRKVLGREPEGWEVYMIWQQGEGGGPALLKADPDAKAVDVIAPLYENRAKAESAIVGNGGTADMTVEEFRGVLRGMYEKRAAQTAAMLQGGDGSLDLSPGDRQDLLTKAEREVKERRDTFRAQIEDRLDAARTAYRAGEKPDWEPSDDDYRAAYGPDWAKEKALTLQAKQVGEFGNWMRDKTPEQIMAELDKMKPGDTTDPLYIQKAKDYETLLKAADAEIKADRKAAEDEAKAKQDAAKNKIDPLMADAEAAAERGADWTQIVAPTDILAAEGDVNGRMKIAALEKSRVSGAVVAMLPEKTNAELQGIINSPPPDAGKPGIDAQQAIYDAARKAAKEELEAREKDPAGYVVAHSDSAKKALAAAIEDPEKWGAFIKLSMQRQAELGLPPSAIQPLPAEALTSVTGALAKAPNASAAAQVLGAILPTKDKDAAGAILNQIASQKDKSARMWAIAGGLMLDGDDGAQAALSVLKGMEVAKANPGMAATATDTVGASMQAAIGDALKRSPAMRAAIVDAALAVYTAKRADAGMMTGGDAQATIDETMLAEALTAVTGGIVEWNGQKLIPPVRGMSESAFEDMMDGLTIEDIGGKLPLAGDDSPVKLTDIKEDGRLYSVGDGVYEVWMPSANGYSPLRSPDGDAIFEIDLNGSTPNAKAERAWVAAGAVAGAAASKAMPKPPASGRQ